MAQGQSILIYIKPFDHGGRDSAFRSCLYYIGLILCHVSEHFYTFCPCWRSGSRAKEIGLVTDTGYWEILARVLAGRCKRLIPVLQRQCARNKSSGAEFTRESHSISPSMSSIDISYDRILKNMSWVWLYRSGAPMSLIVLEEKNNGEKSPCHLPGRTSLDDGLLTKLQASKRQIRAAIKKLSTTQVIEAVAKGLSST